MDRGEIRVEGTSSKQQTMIATAATAVITTVTAVERQILVAVYPHKTNK